MGINRHDFKPCDIYQTALCLRQLEIALCLCYKNVIPPHYGLDYEGRLLLHDQKVPSVIKSVYAVRHFIQMFKSLFFEMIEPILMKLHVHKQET